MQKSPKKVVFYRRTYSLLEAFAFIGGLTLFIVVVLFMLRWFGESYYDMALASVIYRDKTSKSYSLRYYLAQKIAKILKPLGFAEKWEKTGHFDHI